MQQSWSPLTLQPFSEISLEIVEKKQQDMDTRCPARHFAVSTFFPTRHVSRSFVYFYRSQTFRTILWVRLLLINMCLGKFSFDSLRLFTTQRTFSTVKASHAMTTSNFYIINNFSPLSVKHVKSNSKRTKLFMNLKLFLFYQFWTWNSFSKWILTQNPFIVSSLIQKYFAFSVLIFQNKFWLEILFQ